ncbi:spermidine/putrescine ABC transporter ATP-binding protein PotA [Desulfopila aestuarii]|uniref:Spermidine/putrescine import ATP-binding protein PotA n=1 Tax=Desulfopila aestuarii DSM 18488 TaxID=1121416 RepID=A0A1M7YB54_9BACT|nr:spermidine/putrescine ABC transporter ATP-binding protein PotA [Desulfopila aestuarii]SHO49758.1 spermidine/putrescine transport system ATP-binding protein [Desulfopila aestuarii DSM 18488]
MVKSVLSLRGLKKAFSGQTVLADFSLDISHGEFVTLLGPSGCGKTTLLRLVAGFETPDDGAVFLDGTDISQLPPEKRQVNTVFQSYALFPHMTVFDNVAFGLRLKKMKGKVLAERVRQVLVQVKMREFADRYPGELSGGQQQRVAIARAIVNTPRVLLLDEPLSALDARLRREMQMELKRLQRELGIAFILVTHDQEEALSMSDRVIVMQDGRIAQIGTPREVYEDPANLYVARFIGDINLFPGKVTECIGENELQVDVFGKSVQARTKKKLQTGQQVLLLLRPEDLRLTENTQEEMPIFHGAIMERSYRGSTLDTTIHLDDGPVVRACEFFDEDDPDFDYRVGERVKVSWVRGWEVVLPDEDYAH